MAVDRRLLKVLISSKQSEFRAEREDISAIMDPMPLLAVNAAESWAPESMAVERKSVEEAAGCSIYVGLFGCIYSEPTILEYQAASSNPNREILVYVRDCAKRDKRLEEFLEAVLHPRYGRTVVTYEDWVKVRNRFQDHLWNAIARMVELALRLANPPVALGADAVMARKWAQEKEALIDLGLPADSNVASQLARELKSEIQRRQV